jgi:hypothetical protein
MPLPVIRMAPKPRRRTTGPSPPSWKVSLGWLIRRPSTHLGAAPRTQDSLRERNFGLLHPTL